MSHLRFTPVEFRALCRACHSIDLTKQTLPALQRLLVRSLCDAWPCLAERVARFGESELRLLYEHLRGPDDARFGLTLEELRLVWRAWEASVPRPRFAVPLQTVLVYTFRKSTPGLAKKLARLSNDQFVGLCELLQERKRRMA